ncbi:cobalt-precorrin 5A hydrolase [Senegalia massiliensis]|uniref:cobalt-precorrin 5A hydrolase n=1 Tax=Senegalia massiliensis TaxID=1720316 RepID=UPI00102F94B2|nr:cobalt-precorrin 5A hydrolase [Senegalia massiliensis]
MKLAIITLTKGGLKKALQVKRYLRDTPIYTLDKHDDGRFKSIKGKLSENIEYFFKNYDTILFIMATGIVVRSIAAHIKDKTIDPAILVMDEGGKHIISLLSGHIGGSNSYAIHLSKLIGATPVITTASDVNGVLSVDMISKELNLSIENMEDAKIVTADIVNGKKVGIKSDISIDKNLIKNLITPEDEGFKDIQSLIAITNSIKKYTMPTSVLIPKNIVLGIGCRRGIEKNRILDAIYKSMDKNNLYMESLKEIATVDVKKDEIGLIESSKELNISLNIITREEIKKVEHLFEGSNFVKKTIGVSSVSEPVGYIVSNNGTCIMKKTKMDGITISIWEENNE